MKSSADIELWERIRLGDTEAFHALYEKYIDDLIVFGQRICADNDLVQDTLQQLFLKLWESKSTLTQPDHTKAYLMKSLRNNLLRAVQRERVISEIDIEHHLRDVPGVTICRDDKEEIRRLKLAMQQLPARQREILHLRFYQDVKNPEIADIMGISYQSVSNLLRRAIKQMKLLVPDSDL